jgi:hypothetical protein
MKYKYTVTAVRWFDKINGNTYHSARVFDNETGNMIYCPFRYGYGDCYRQTALDAMAERGWLPEQYCGRHGNGSPKWGAYERENNYPILWNVTDGKKKECVANGKEA